MMGQLTVGVLGKAVSANWMQDLMIWSLMSIVAIVYSGYIDHLS